MYLKAVQILKILNLWNESYNFVIYPYLVRNVITVVEAKRELIEKTTESTVINGDNFQFTRTSKIDTRAFIITFGYTFRTEFEADVILNKFSND
jgi:hypothetical protein